MKKAQITFREFMTYVEKQNNLNQHESTISGYPSDPEFQKRLEKERKKRKQQKEQQIKQRSDELYRERVHGPGIPARHGGKWGYIKDGKFTPNEDASKSG